MTRPRRAVPGRLLALAACLCAAAGCARTLRAPDVAAVPGTPVDSVTVALWRMDETAGLRVADAGPSRLDATAGEDTRPTFGRFRNARLFSSSVNSFLYVPWRAGLELPAALSIEAWIAPNAYSIYEDMVIAERWQPQTDDRSWIFSLICGQIQTGGGLHSQFVRGRRMGRLLFVFQSDDASIPQAYSSQTMIELQRWTHVAVTYDGRAVAFWVNGQLDGIFAAAGRIRASRAPLLIGNHVDTRHLSEFGGELHLDTSASSTPYYAFDGGMDELRLSSAARTEFPLQGGR